MHRPVPRCFARRAVAVLMAVAFCVSAPYALADDAEDNGSTIKMVSQQNAEDVDHTPSSRRLSATDYEGIGKRLDHPSSLFPWITANNSWLQQHGFLIVGDNMNEFMGAVTKPTPGIRNLRQGASNAGQTALSVTTDWYRLAHIHGLASRFVIVGRYGTPANRMFGDWLAHSSEIYGGGGNVVAHFVMGYFEEHLWQDRLAIAAGRMAQLSDFVTGTMFCNFVNNSFCGRPRAAGDSVYTTTWPVSVWATRVRVRPMPDVYVQLGVYFTEKDLYSVVQNRSGWKFNGANIVGQVFPAEFGWEPHFGRRGVLVGHYKIGASIENVRRTRPYSAPSSLAEDAGEFSSAGRRGAWAAWALADQRIISFSRHDAAAGISVMGGVLLNDPTIALRQRQFYVGAVMRGFWPARPTDTIGIGASWTKIADSVQRAESCLIGEGRPLPYNATGRQSEATVFEAYYAFGIGRAVVIQPDFQYYLRPNGQRNLRDAAMIGFRSHVEIF